MTSALGQKSLRPATSADANNSKKTSAAVSLSDQDGEAIFAAVETAIAAYLDEPGANERWQALLEAKRMAADVVTHLARRDQNAKLAVAARELLKKISAAGIHDMSVGAEDAALAQTYATEGWPGLLAAMILVPAWQWPFAPSLDNVPDWLWPDYTAWLFAVPQGFCVAGHADVYANHVLRRLDELVRWVDRNAGSSAVRAALNAYVQGANSIPLYFSKSSLKQHAELRGRLLTRAFARDPNAFDRLPEPRSGRRLRVGFVNRHFGSQTETYTTLPTFEHLDADRFEVILFAHHGNNSPLENHCRRQAADFRVLPAELEAQVALLREANLDVIVFGTNVTAVCNEVTLLALHRMAPLQIVNNSSCVTSGLPNIDLYVSGTLTESPEAPSHFTERLGLLPGPAHAFNYEADGQQPSVPLTRASLGIPDDATLFVTAANYYKIIPEMQEAWAELLASTPGSRLLVHPFNPNWSSSYPIKRFRAEFDRVLAAHGIDRDRLVVSTARFPSRADVKTLIALGEIYLDTFPFGGVNSLVDPLESGVVPVVWEGQTFRSRMGAALLRTLGLDDLIAKDLPSYLAIARKIATDATSRQAIQEKIKAAMERTPLFLDTLAASDAFGSLIEIAFDELVLAGAEAFRADRTPLTAEQVGDASSALAAATYLYQANIESEAVGQARRVLASQPASPEARHLLGAALLRQDRPEIAVQYLLAAVQHAEGSAGIWHDLAIALRRSGRTAESFQALQTCLKIEPTSVDTWLMTGEWALEARDAEKVSAISDALREIAPADPRVEAFLASASTASLS
jgi:protein O-GlcNAc transferase